MPTSFLAEESELEKRGITAKRRSRRRWCSGQCRRWKDGALDSVVIGKVSLERWRGSGPAWSVERGVKGSNSSGSQTPRS